MKEKINKVLISNTYLDSSKISEITEAIEKYPFAPALALRKTLLELTDLDINTINQLQEEVLK